VTKPTEQQLNEAHHRLYKESDNGELGEKELDRILTLEVGHTVVNKYLDMLERFGYIEKVADSYIVARPEEELSSSGEKVRSRVTLPKEISEAADQFGLDLSKLLLDACVREITGLKEFFRSYIGEELSQEETDYVLRLFRKNLHLKKGDKNEQARRDMRRRDIYKECFDTDQSDRNHISELRKKAVDLDEMLAI
jgi:hypothetical protein